MNHEIVNVNFSFEELEALHRSMQHAINNWPKFVAATKSVERSASSAHFYDELKFRLFALMEDEPDKLLEWKDEPKKNFSAVLGNSEDGVVFAISSYPTCYRRGKWRLLITVYDGPHHHDWGCFDEADQPQRWYHDLNTAFAEAERIAKVLYEDRLKHGPLE